MTRRRAATGAAFLLALVGCGPADDVSLNAPIDEAALLRAAGLASVCSGCHRAGGAAVIGLEGRNAEDLAASLRTYRDDPGDTVMHRLARGYGDTEIDLIAGYLASESEG